MAQVRNVRLEVLNNAVKVTGRLEFNPNEVGKKYAIKIFVFADDTGESNTINVVPLYTFKFGEPEGPIATSPHLASLSKAITAATNVNINETRRLDLSKLNEDPGFHLEHQAGQTMAVPNLDEVYAVIKLFKSTDLNNSIATGKSERVVGAFA